jgi:hypothetical protein
MDASEFAGHFGAGQVTGGSAVMGMPSLTTGQAVPFEFPHDPQAGAVIDVSMVVPAALVVAIGLSHLEHQLLRRREGSTRPSTRVRADDDGVTDAEGAIIRR